MGSPVTPLAVPEEITTLGGAIRWARKQRNLTQEQLAVAAGLTAGASVSLIESGITGTYKLAAFARALGVPELELEQRPKGRDPHHRDGRLCRPFGKELTHTEAAARPTVEPRRCGLCRKPEHLTANCPLRVGRSSKRVCSVCCGLAHRRPRKVTCDGCGERYAPEPPVSPEDCQRSSAGYTADQGYASQERS